MDGWTDRVEKQTENIVDVLFQHSIFFENVYMLCK